jgi:serine/threonine protein kinase
MIAHAEEIGSLGGYRLLKVLGAGGPIVAFQAEDPQDERPLVVKMLRPELAAKSEARMRFLRAARCNAAVADRHNVPVYQVEDLTGIPFLTMPLLSGESLEARLQREGKLPALEVLRIARAVAMGLAAAHAQGVIHGDLRPANVWLESGPRGRAPQGRPEVIGNGSCGAAGDEIASATPFPFALSSRVSILDFGLGQMSLAPDSIPADPCYLAPEQANGQALDCRCDLFSLGCVLYRMCTGFSPFRGDDAMAVLAAAALEDPRAPHEIDPTVPLALSELIVDLLAKKPSDRPPSAAAVLAMLDAEALPPTMSDKTDSGGELPAPRFRRSRWFAAALLILGGCGWLVLHIALR